MARRDPFDPRTLDEEALWAHLDAPPLDPSPDRSALAPMDDTTPVLTSPHPGVSDTMPVPDGGTLANDNVAKALPGPPPPSGAAYTGYQPKYAMEGFNFGREQNPGKSAKDAFAMLANQAPPPPLNDKTALGQWFTQYIQPGMESLGHHVSSVNGDTFSYANPEGAYTIDYGRGAGAEGGALAWQAQEPGQGQGPAGATKNPVPTPTGATLAADQVLRDTSSEAATTEAPSGETDFDRVMREIAALQSGQPSPLDADALRQLLGV